MMKKLKLLIIFYFFLLNVYSHNITNKNKNITLQLSWLNQFQFAGYYIAKEKGYYNDVGLNVNIKEFNFNLDIQHVLENKEADFVVGKTSSIIDKIAGQELVALAAIFQHSPMMLLVRKDSNIKTVTDLRNKNIMITNDAKNTAAILAMLSSQKVQLNEINIQSHSFNLDDLINGTTDAMASYISNEPIRLKDKNIEYNILHPKDYGFDFYNGILFTSKQMIHNDPDTVKAFYDATIKGWEYAFNNIEESAKLIFDKYNTQEKTLNNLVKEGSVLKTLAYDENGNIGTLNENRIKEIANVFLVLGLINKEYTLNGFIYEYNGANKNKIYLTKNEKMWLEKHKKITYSGTNWEPIHSYSKENRLEGIAEDIIREVTKYGNINFEFVKKGEWADVLNSVKNKTLDFAIATGETAERKEYGIFTKEYASFPLVIVTKDNVSFISKTSELNNKIVAVGKNYTAHEILKENYPNIKLHVVENTNEALKAVSNNEAYAMVDILPVVVSKMRNLNLVDLKISGTTNHRIKIRAFVRSDYPQLVSIINKGIDNIDDKTKEQIVSKWLKVEYVREIDYDMLIKVSLAFTLLIVLVFYYQNRKLRISNRKLKNTLIDLKNTRKDLIAAEKMATLGELVGGVTHELSSPLSVSLMGATFIVDNTNELLDQYNNKNLDEDEFKTYITTVQDTSKSIIFNLDRTKDLLKSFKSIAIDQAIEDKRDYNVNQYIEEVLTSLNSKLKLTNINVIVECDKGLEINSYPGCLAQILINFINNSLLHAFKEHENAEIKISVKKLSHEIQLIYSDNGIGISEENKNNIFKKYYTTKRGDGGTGLGLHIVKSIVKEKLRGTINIESQLDHGTTFIILIPIN